MADEMELQGIEEAKENPEAVPQALVMVTTVLLVFALLLVYMHMGSAYKMGPFG